MLVTEAVRVLNDCDEYTVVPFTTKERLGCRVMVILLLQYLVWFCST